MTRVARRMALAVVAALLAAAGLTACARAPARPNVVVLLVDTLRWDRLGAYDSPRGLTPAIDALAARSFVFRHAYAQSSWTNPSVASLFTSRYQSQHGIVSFGSHLADGELTLAEMLKAQGWATGGFSANFLLQGQLGFGQGFDRWSAFSQVTGEGVNKYIKARAPKLNQAGLAWLDETSRGGTPFFLYLHYMEPHPPYAPEPEVLASVLGTRPAFDLAKANDAMAMWPIVDFTTQPELVQGIVDYYDAEVRSFDAQLALLIGELERRGVLDNSIVVLVADHGEELLEHGRMGHNINLFEPVIRVPLLIHLPGQRQRIDVERLVSLTDVTPTLLELAGLPIPAACAGHSRATLLRGLAGGRWSLDGLRAWWRGDDSPPLAYSELIKPPDATRYSPHERAVVHERDKLIAGADGEREFYDLAADPGEQNPNALDPGRRAVLERALERLRALAGGEPVPTKVLDEQTKERMRALGYQE